MKRITISRHVTMIKNCQKKRQLIYNHLTDPIFSNRLKFSDLYNSCMLFPHLSFLSAQQRSVCCLINEHDDDDDLM